MNIKSESPTSLTIEEKDSITVILFDEENLEAVYESAQVAELTGMVADAHEACYSEYMGCPWCTGHRGHEKEYHDEFCSWAKLDA